MMLPFEDVNLKDFHGLVVAHVKKARGMGPPSWWRELGQMLDAWGKASGSGLGLKLKIRFGDLENEELSLDQQFHFATKAEADAFMLGVACSNEWHGYHILEDERPGE